MSTQYFSSLIMVRNRKRGESEKNTGSEQMKLSSSSECLLFSKKFSSTLAHVQVHKSTEFHSCFPNTFSMDNLV